MIIRNSYVSMIRVNNNKVIFRKGPNKDFYEIEGFDENKIKLLNSIEFPLDYNSISDKNVKELIDTLMEVDYLVQSINEEINWVINDTVLEKGKFNVCFFSNYDYGSMLLINKKLKKENVKGVISYIENDVFFIVPIIGKGCLNCFELFKKSTQYNNISYELLQENVSNPTDSDIDFCLTYLSKYVKLLMKDTSLSKFAIRFDLDLLEMNKIKLFKFPRCNHCYDEEKVKHPFL